MRRQNGLLIICLMAFAGTAPLPAVAATAIDVRAGATGDYQGTYTIGVTYFSPFGLTVSDSGPLNGTTGSYSPASAPVGLTAIWLAAAVNGLNSGSGTAGADLTNGTVRGAATSDGYHSGGTAAADLYEDVTFAIAGGSSRQIAVLAHLDGSIGSFANASSLSALSYTLNFGSSGFRFASQGSQSGFDVSAGGVLGGPPMGWDSYTLSNVTSTGFDFTGLLTIADGEVRSILQRLYLNCQEGVDCDFSHTGRMALRLPTGVTFTSGSGVFLTAPFAAAVPEPASWAMLTLGFGLCGTVARRRRRVAASATVGSTGAQIG